MQQAAKDPYRSQERIDSSQEHIEQSKERVERGKQRTAKGYEIPSPSKSEVMGFFKKVARAPKRA